MLDRPEIKLTAEEKFDEALLRLKNKETFAYYAFYHKLALALENLKDRTLEEVEDGNISNEHAKVIAESADSLISEVYYYHEQKRYINNKAFCEAINRYIDDFNSNINPISKNSRNLQIAFWVLVGMAIGCIFALMFLGVGVLGSFLSSIVIWKNSEAAALIGGAFTTFTGAALGYRYGRSNPKHSTAEKIIYTVAGLAIGLGIGQLIVGAMLWYELAINIVDALSKATPLLLAGAGAIWSTCTLFGGRVGYERTRNPNAPIDNAGKKLVEEIHKCTGVRTTAENVRKKRSGR